MNPRSILLLSVLLGALAARGDTIDLSSAPARVRASNPGLRAARLEIDRARGRLQAAGRLANPALSVEWQGESGLSPQATGFALEQAFPLTNRLKLEKRLSEQMLRSAEWEVRDAERLRIGEAQALVVRILALDQQRALRERQAALARELAEFARTRSATGELSPLDAAQALVDAQQAMLAGRSLEAERVGALGELKPLLGIPGPERLDVTGSLPPLVLPAPGAWEGRPDLEQAKLGQEVARTDVDLAKSKRWEDVTAGVFAAGESQRVPGQGREHTGFLGVRFGVPLPIWNRNQGEIAEKSAGLDQAAWQVEALRLEIGNEVAAARGQMESLAALAREIRETLLPAIQEQSARLETAYGRGEAGLLAVLRVREQRLSLEAAALDATRDFHLARVRYEAATGAHVVPDAVE